MLVVLLLLLFLRVAATSTDAEHVVDVWLVCHDLHHATHTSTAPRVTVNSAPSQNWAAQDRAEPEALCTHFFFQIFFPAVLWSSYSSVALWCPLWTCGACLAMQSSCLLNVCHSQIHFIVVKCCSTGFWPVLLNSSFLFRVGQKCKLLLHYQ